MAITTIGTPPQVTIHGAPPNFDKVTKIGTGFSMASNTPGEIGSYATKELRMHTVGNSQSGVVFDSFKADGRMRVVNVETGAQAVTATATIKVYNSTQAADILASVTPATTPVVNTTITTPTIEANDIVQLIATTDGTGALTNVVAKLTVQYLGSPSNAQG